MTLRLSVLLLVLAAAGGCDRAVLEPAQPGLTVESPDLSAVLTQSKLTLRVRADQRDQIASVRIGAQDATRDGDAFTASVTLGRGLTAIPIEGLDADGARVVADTAYALFAEPETDAVPTPTGLDGGGALSATTLPDGRVLIAGGEPLDGDARADATVLRVSGSLLNVERTVALREARYNHSATLLPDGTVLLLGGATRRRPRTGGEFVGTAELVSAGRAESQNVLFVGQAPRRSGHVTRLVEVDGDLILFLIGGVVPGDPPMTTPSIDVLQFVPGATPRLVVLTPPGGAGDLPQVPEPVLLDASSSPTGDAVSLLYGLGTSAPVSARLTWAPPGPASYPVGLSFTDARTLLATPRTGAASALLSDGLFLLSGGQDDGGATLSSIEAVAPAAHRTFLFDASAGLGRARSGHAATSLGPGRMLTIGGYNEAGFPVLAPEITTL